MTGRVYTTTRIRAGDYLLPSNDAQTLWRICSYVEDGSAEDGSGRKITGTFWQVYRWRRDTFPSVAEITVALEQELDEFLDDRLAWWEEVCSGFRTRGAAMEEALSRG